VRVVEDQVDLGDGFRDFLRELGHQPRRRPEVVAILVRTEPNGHVFTFVGLGVRDTERLRALARSTPPRDRAGQS
jgi:hypothetical protein